MKFSRILVATLAIGVAAFSPRVGAAQTNAVSFTGSGSQASNFNQTVGWQFNVLSDITVTGLSWFDLGNDGLGTEHAVGIWNSAGALLTSVTIPSGTSATLNNGFRTVSITNLMLGAGDGYIVGGYNGSASTDWVAFNVANFQIVDGIQFVDATFGSNGAGALERPTFLSAANTGFFGASFTVASVTTVPEPGTYALVGAGLLALMVGRRRRENGARRV